MSSVRMCDRCSNIFPKGTEGSAELAGTKNKKYRDGSPYQEQVTNDFCPPCVDDMNGTAKVPQVLTATLSTVDYGDTTDER